MTRAQLKADRAEAAKRETMAKETVEPEAAAVTAELELREAQARLATMKTLQEIEALSNPDRPPAILEGQLALPPVAG